MTTSTTTVPQVTRARPRRRRRWIKYCAVLFIALLVWAAFDLYAPRRTSMREFDPDEVARLETAMWRSYYSRQRVKLFREMTELLRTQYRLPPPPSNPGASRAARAPLRFTAVPHRAAGAAFVFKDGHSRPDYERALPDLVSFYQSIRAVSDTDFD